MPAVSKAQLRWVNSPAGHKALGEKGVNEWNRASKGLKLPERIKKKAKSGMELLKEATMPKIPKKYKGYKVKVDNKMHDFGRTDDNKREVKINKKKSLAKGGKRELVDTLEHEKYHVRHPKATEKVTYKKTKLKLNKKYGRRNQK